MSNYNLPRWNGLNAGDETRRNGDYVGFDIPDAEGTALDSVTIPQGAPVTYDGTELAESTADADEIVGILSNYEVSGDTGQETVDDEANVKMRGEVLADLSNWDGTGPTEGAYLDDAQTIFVVENVRGDLYRVQVR
jgi:hypothetical protein